MSGFVARALERTAPSTMYAQNRGDRDLHLHMTPDERRVFAIRLAEAMRKVGVNRSHLARSAGCDRRVFWYYLAGVNAPKAARLSAIAFALGCSAEWLAGTDDAPGWREPKLAEKPRVGRPRKVAP